MKRTIIVASVLLAVGLCIGCNKGKDSVESDGTRVFGQRTLKDGTRTIERLEFPDGTKKFGITVRPDHAEKEERVERPDGDKWFEVAYLPDDTVKVARIEKPNGEKWLNVTNFPDGTLKVGRIESPDGKVRPDLTRPPDGTLQETAQSESSHTAAQEDGEACANGAKACEADAQIELLDGDGKFYKLRLPEPRDTRGLENRACEGYEV